MSAPTLPPPPRRTVRLRRNALVAAALAAATAGAADLERRVEAMGTELTVRVTASEPAAARAASEAAISAVEEVERRLSTWRDDSELSHLNRTPAGTPRALSAALAADLAAAARIWRATAGAFDPGVGALVTAWGLRSGGRIPGAAEQSAARAASGLRHLLLEGQAATRLHDGVRLEEGGFGKGIGLDAAVAAARAQGAEAVLVDLGGQVAVAGRAIEVELAAPDDRGRRLARLEVPAGSLATSGNGERAVVIGGRRVSHILDPRSGEPAADFGSVTVWARSATDADALSTGLYAMGPEAALEWAAATPAIEAVVIEGAAGRYRIRATAGARLRALPGVAAEVYTARGREAAAGGGKP